MVKSSKPASVASTNWATAPGSVTARAVCSNLSGAAISDVALQAAVPKWMQVKLHTASGSALKPGASDVVQRMDFANPTPDKAYMLKLKISYSLLGGEAVVAQATVSEFPKPVQPQAAVANLLF